MNPIYILQKLIANSSHTKTISLKRNQFLTQKNALDTNLYFIENGSLKIYFTDQDQEHILRFGYTHNIIVCLDSFLTNQPTQLYIQALKKTTVKSISKIYFKNLLLEYDQQNLWTTVLEQLLLDQLEREKDILIQSPKDRYLRVFKRSPNLFQEIPNTHIAKYLRMSPETLSRLKKS